MVTLQTILDALPLPYQLHAPVAPATVAVSGVCADSRFITPGDLFVAIRGGAHDGHQYIAQAVAAGAAAVFGSAARQDVNLPATTPYVELAEPRLALAYASAALQGFPSHKLTVIGVTGTDGKTTTSTLIESILGIATRTAVGPAGRVGVITTVGARIRGQESDTGLHVTTPDAPEVQRFLAEMVVAGCAYGVVESTSHGLDQERVGAVAFDVAAVTNITHEHLDYHGTRDAYVQAKAKLFRALYHTPVKPGVPKVAVINADDEGSYAALCSVLDAEAQGSAGPVVRRSYGLGAANPADVIARAIVYSPAATRFSVQWWGGELPIETPLIGDFNVYNVLCAVTTCLSLGIAPAVIQEGVAAMRGVSGRMERIDGGQPFLAVVDFAHSPASLERALKTLRGLVGRTPQGQPGRLIAVFGSAGLRDRAKRRLMGEVSGRLADYTVITAEDPRTEDLDAINREIAAGVSAANPVAAYRIVADRAAAIQAAVDMAEAGDVVAAFGKGHERSMCFGTVETPWSDQDAMSTALATRFGPASTTR